MELAAGRQLRRVRNRAVDPLQAPGRSLQPGHGLQQSDRVRMLRVRQNVLRRPGFHDPPRVHHVDPVRHVRDEPEVVRDQQDRHAELLLERPEQLHDLRLDRHIQRGRRLVGDQQVRAARKRHRDHRALLHPAAELVRIRVHPALRFRQADEIHQPDHLVAHIHVRAVKPNRLADLVADAEDRIQRFARLLEHIGNFLAAQFPQRGLVHPQDIPPLVKNPSALVDSRRLRHQPRQRKRRHAFAAPALAHQRDRLALADRKTDAVHGPDHPPLRLEAGPQVLHVQ